MKIYVVLYSHRHGIDVFAYKSKEGAEKAAAEIEADESFEEDRGEAVEITETDLEE